MYSSHSSILYCDVHNYQIYSLDRALIWKSASPFSLTRSIENAKRMEFDGPVVYIGDIFDGSNFSHFLFDHMTRLGLCIDRHFKNKLCSVDALTFISSGIPTEFHNRVADAVCTVYGLRRKQIVFPNSPTNILSRDAIYWFSDSYEDNIHPAQLMNPSSVGVLRSISDAIAITPGRNKKIYISRADAVHRRVTNESDLIENLSELGFSIFRFSEISLEDQIAAVRGADIIVAPHGMALTICAFIQKMSKVIELFHPCVGTDAYASLCKAMGLKYSFVIGRSSDTAGDFEISIAEVLTEIQQREE